MKDFLLTIMFFWILSTNVSDAQMVMDYDELLEHPCLSELFGHLEKNLNEVIDSSSAAIIAHYHIDAQHKFIRYDSASVFSSTSQRLNLPKIDSVFQNANLIDIPCQNLPAGRLIIPVAVLHPVWMFWHPLIGSDFRKVEAARQLLHAYRSNGETEVSTIFFLRRHLQWEGGKYIDYISEH